MPYCAPSRAWTSFRGEGGQGVTGGKVLIVEDNPVNLRLAQFLLEKKGFSVRKAGSGTECLAEMTRELPDIVLMDIQLPGEDGLAITARSAPMPGRRASSSSPSPPTPWPEIARRFSAPAA